MRFIFKTDYGQDIKLAKHGGHIFWYGLLLLALLAAPWVVAEYWLAQFTFILIYAIAGLGLIQIPAYDVKRHLDAGELVEVMPQHRAMPMPMTLLRGMTGARRRTSSSGVRSPVKVTGW